VGERKAEQLGTLFTFAIAAYCRNNNLPSDLPSTMPSRRPKPKPDSVKSISVGKSEAFKMFRRGCSIEQTAHEVERAASTVWQYLEQYIERERPESIGTWVSDATYARVCDSFARISGERLKPIFDDLKGEVPYEQIRIVAAHRRALGLVPPR
jgi:ATP-dependent DNA helicase RecQ